MAARSPARCIAQRRPPLPRRRHPHPALALAALATACAQLAWTADARAQSSADSAFQPSLTDPRYAQRFNAPSPTTRATAADPTPIPRQSSAGETGSDSTGALAKKRKARRKPGDPRPLPPPPPPSPGPPQQTSGQTTAQQVKVREPYAEAYRPPGAPPRRPPKVEQDAYEPLGLRVGTFLVKPSVDVSRGFDSNPGRIPNGKSSGYTVVEPALQVRSQWSRHEAGLDLRGSYSDYDSLPSSNRPQVEAKSYTRFDVSHDTAINTEGRFLLSTDYPGSPNLPADIAKLPIFTTIGGSLGLTQRFNHLELMGKANIDRTAYQDSQLTDGTTSSNHDRDYNQFGGQVRASYEIYPGVKPFAEIAGDIRKHDLQYDRSGFERDSQALTPKVGTSFEISRKLTGEIAVGYQTRDYKDPNLQDLRGVVADASLKWQATGLTTATLTASSRADEIVTAGTSGVLRRDVGVQVDHAFRRWLIGTVRVGYGFDDYVGSDRADNRWSLGTSITYKLSREFSLKGEYRYDQLRSNTPGVDYNANTFLIGLKLQR